MQGDIWAPLSCETSIDSKEQECLNKKKYLYKYRERKKPS